MCYLPATRPFLMKARSLFPEAEAASGCKRPSLRWVALPHHRGYGTPGVASGQVPRLYRQRWEIETLFAAMKSRGFGLEATPWAVQSASASLSAF